jgi:hypothetical protein
MISQKIIYQAMKNKDWATIRSLVDDPVFADRFCNPPTGGPNTVPDLGDTHIIMMVTTKQSAIDLANGIKYAKSQTFDGTLRANLDKPDNHTTLKWMNSNTKWINHFNRGNGWESSEFYAASSFGGSLVCDGPGRKWNDLVPGG